MQERLRSKPKSRPSVRKGRIQLPLFTPIEEQEEDFTSIENSLDEIIDQRKIETPAAKNILKLEDIAFSNTLKISSINSNLSRSFISEETVELQSELVLGKKAVGKINSQSTQKGTL